MRLETRMTDGLLVKRRVAATAALAVLLSFSFAGEPMRAQTAAAGATSSRVVGTITSASAGVLVVKTDAGAERKVTVPDGIKIQRVAPGEKDLSQAAVIQFSELSIGDRVLVRLAAEPSNESSNGSSGGSVTAISIIAIPHADLAQKQQKEREEWGRNGVGGLVKSIDAGTGVVVVTSGAGATQKTITLHTTPATVLKRYAADSVDFDQAKAAPIESIQPGDQLRARGSKSADGLQVEAQEIVSGSFRNISGTIASVNVAASTVVLKDLASKQNVTVHVGTEVQMRKLPEDMAKQLANMTGSGTAPGGPGAAGSGRPQGIAAGGPPGDANRGPAPGQAAGPSQGEAMTRPGGAGNGRSNNSGDAGVARRGDLQSVLNRAPQIHLADLQKGDAVMLVSTQGTSDVKAITLLAGVEPLLQAPASTQNMLLSNWNMSSGGAEAAQ